MKNCLIKGLGFFFSHCRAHLNPGGKKTTATHPEVVSLYRSVRRATTANTLTCQNHNLLKWYNHFLMLGIFQSFYPFFFFLTPWSRLWAETISINRNIDPAWGSPMPPLQRQRALAGRRTTPSPKKHQNQQGISLGKAAAYPVELHVEAAGIADRLALRVPAPQGGGCGVAVGTGQA